MSCRTAQEHATPPCSADGVAGSTLGKLTHARTVEEASSAAVFHANAGGSARWASSLLCSLVVSGAAVTAPRSRSVRRVAPSVNDKLTEPDPVCVDQRSHAPAMDALPRHVPHVLDGASNGAVSVPPPPPKRLGHAEQSSTAGGVEPRRSRIDPGAPAANSSSVPLSPPSYAFARDAPR
jgi:hypothetical protein